MPSGSNAARIHPWHVGTSPTTEGGKGVIAPSRRLAKATHAEPGHTCLDRASACWRWDGDDWRPLQPGDTILDANRVNWFLWTGTEGVPVNLGVGAVVRVSWERDGVHWKRQLCGVVDIEYNPADPSESLLLVGPWPCGDQEQVAVVPRFAAELVAPASTEQLSGPD